MMTGSNDEPRTTIMSTGAIVPPGMGDHGSRLHAVGSSALSKAQTSPRSWGRVPASRAGGGWWGNQRVEHLECLGVGVAFVPAASKVLTLRGPRSE